MNNDVRHHMVADLKELYEEDAAAQTLLDWAANRQNDATQTAIDYLALRAGTDRRRAIELAKRLDEIGCGEFIVGRRGAKSRIVWSVSLKSIGRAAQGTNREVEPVDPELLAESDLKDDGRGSPLTISEAKQRLAVTFGVSPDAIEITVRA